MELTNVFALRRSCRSYTDQQLSEAELTAVLNAGLQTPAAKGRFDKLRFVVVQDKAVLDALNSSFAATIGNEAAYPTYHAPTVIFVACDSSDDPALQGANAACAVEHMALAATDQGLGSVYLFGVCNILKDSAQASALLQLPVGFHLVSALAVGHPTAPAQPREPDPAKIVVTRI
ncbi:MAG: nitroreductase family protein [Clostridiales bacterium]|nr:nitroreductase family protein [Clostridiales bacterium]